MHWIKPSGAPSLLAASDNIFNASAVHCAAFGCGLATIPFLHFKDIRALYIAVDVGFVEGINAQTTPIGTAIFKTFPFCSLPINPTVFKSLMDS
jgi:hypothetical protein